MNSCIEYAKQTEILKSYYFLYITNVHMSVTASFCLVRGFAYVICFNIKQEVGYIRLNSIFHMDSLDAC